MTILYPEARPDDEKWLVYDNRAALNAAGQPGLHAFIAGASNYPNLPGHGEPTTEFGLGMRRLTSTSLTAYLIFDWLLKANQAGNLVLPLATCRLLLTPTPAESAAATPPRVPIAPPMSVLNAPRCNLKNFTDAAAAWRKSAKVRRDDATLFYFAGHGIQLPGRNQALLLDEFGEPAPIGRNMVDVNSLRYGMAPYANIAGMSEPSAARPNIARTQFYFIDACRNQPKRIRALERLPVNSVFNIETSDVIDDRRAPIFYASLPDGVAQAVPDEQTIFSIALMRCIHGEAAKPPDGAPGKYYVSSQSINEGLRGPLVELNRQFRGRQWWIADGFGEDVVLCYLNHAPRVPISIMIESTAPLPPQTAMVVEVKDLSKSVRVCKFQHPPDNRPFSRVLEAGPYELSASLAPPCSTLPEAKKNYYFAEPLRPRFWKVEVP